MATATDVYMNRNWYRRNSWKAEPEIKELHFKAISDDAAENLYSVSSADCSEFREAVNRTAEQYE